MDKEIELAKKMHRLKIFEKDIKEQFVRSSKPGGQNVNKVSSCVVLMHVPTGLLVKCQSQRSQNQNRHKARFLLVQKIEHQLKMDELKLRQDEALKKRQNRKRPKLVKEHILEAKHLKSEKKGLRKKIRPEDVDG
jgi:protein subunit release factor B